MPKRLHAFFGACAAAVAILMTMATAADDGDRTDAVRSAVQGGSARYVILYIGDGMGDSEITAARNYAVGPNGRLALDTLPMTGVYTTYSVQERNPDLPDFVPDSAATGTAWATGHKTSNDRISTTAGDDRDLPTILELAQARGYRVGDVTTAELTDATPAVLASHVANRVCQGPTDMSTLCPQDRKSARGPGSIAEQLVDHHVDVLMGGSARFEQPTDAGPLVVQTALAAGYRIVGAQAGLATPSSGSPPVGSLCSGQHDGGMERS